MSEFKAITSKDNALIKLVSSLQSSSKARKENGLFVLEGLRICKDAYENDILFEKLIVSETALNKYREDISVYETKAKECFQLTDSLFAKISDTVSPQGIIGICKIPDNSRTLNIKGRYIALENIQDPSNLGAISRTAEALGVNGIILAGGCDPYAPKSLRASMGTLLRMPLFQFSEISDLEFTELKAYACVVNNDALPITDIGFEDGCVVVIGNEANGITEETKGFCDELVTIPMSGKVESLNAAVAASIAMWEMMK